jgi:formate dehydrogenase major subunit
MANSDCILFMGSNMAEAQPVGFRWPMKGKERGATLIHVDPRFTRMSAVSDVYVGIRSGSDIVFLGGLVNYVLSNERWFHEYVMAYTNASTIIEEGFEDTEDLEGVFSGFDRQSDSYDAKQGDWGYENCAEDVQQDSANAPAQAKSEKGRPGLHGHGIDGNAEAFTSPCKDKTAIERDPTLQHPRCVMQILRRHFARYTPELVSTMCGCTQEQFARVAELLCANSGRERTTCIAYALGWTQHTTGVQIIRTAGILQLLLGNMGRPGGGIMALRGHSTIQGATDVSTLYDTLPGYLPQPAAYDRSHEDLSSYIKHEGMPTGGWTNFSKYIVSLLKAWYGDAATANNDFGFSWIPRVDADYSMLAYFDRMTNGGVKGYFLTGMNPAGGGPNAGLHRAGLRNLDWLVVLDWFETESAVFWKNDPNAPPPSDIKTEVFLLPAAAAPEKEGSLTNTQRLIQWHNKAVDPIADCRSDAWYLYNLGKRLKKLYAGSTDPRDQALLNLTWDYDFDEQPRLPDGTLSRIEGEPDLEKVLMEMNGYRLDEIDPRTGRPRLVSAFAELNDDGTTASGCWVYSGVFPEPGRNRANERIITDDPFQPEWGFSWPNNVRVLYNRASADPEGKPWSERKKLVWWDAEKKCWVGLDKPDFELNKPPEYRPPAGATGMAAIAGNQPFTMKTDGLGWLYSPGVKDGPLPTHYEPVESPLGNLLYPKHNNNPTVRFFEGPLNRIAHAPSTEFPIVATTFRLTEHYLSGPMSRFNSWLNELQPEMFAELSPELAAERGIVHGGWMRVQTARGQIEVRAMVTRRLRPFVIEGRTVHQIGLPFHWAFAGEIVGANANDLTAIMADPNVSMHECKAFACQVYAGRLEGQALQPTEPTAHWPTLEPIPDTPASSQPEGRLGHGK